MSRLCSSTKDAVTFVVKRSVKRFLTEGKRHFDSGNVTRAIELYQSALREDPLCGLIYFNLGFAYHEEHDMEKARRAYLRAIDLMPECSLFYEHLARLCFEDDDYDEAIRFFSKAIDNGDMQPISYGLLGRAYYEKGLFEEAAASLEQMLAEEDNPPLVAVARYHLVLSYLRLRRIADARRTTLELLGDEDADPQLLSDLGERFAYVKCISVARQLYERVIVRSEEHIHARKCYEDILNLENIAKEALAGLRSDDEECILHVIMGLLKVGVDAAAQELAPLVYSSSAMIRECALAYHEKFGYELPERVDALLRDDIAYVRERAAAYVVALHPRDGANLLLPLLKDPAPEVRRQAARYFVSYGGVEHLGAVDDALRMEQDEKTREHQRQAIEAIKARYELRTRLMARRRPRWGFDFGFAWHRWMLAGVSSLSLGYILYRCIACL